MKNNKFLYLMMVLVVVFTTIFAAYGEENLKSEGMIAPNEYHVDDSEKPTVRPAFDWSDMHVETTVAAEIQSNAKGPEVVEYYDYKQETKQINPGSLGSQYDISTIGKGLFYDGNDFYFFTDTGIIASNYMYTIEGDRFFFGEDGKMVKNTLIFFNDETYYFDTNGAMYKNRWHTEEEIDAVENTITYTDYYFGPSGRAYRATNGGLVVKTIDGEKYGFNSDCEKLEGYYDDQGNKYEPEDEDAYAKCDYYFDPEEGGAAAKGWVYYEGSIRGEGYTDNEEIALYFDEKTGRKVASKRTGTGRAISRVIDGQRYMFDENGVRKNKWYNQEIGRATISDMKYFDDDGDGFLTKGWFQAIPGSATLNGEDLILDVNKKRHNDDEYCWFYAGGNGRILRKTIRKIGNYTYAFDDDGVMQAGAFVRARGNEFVKAYSTDDLTRKNILLDLNAYGGSADPDPNGVGNPTNLDKEKGLLDVQNGERWLYFLSEDIENESMVGSMLKINQAAKIELADTDIEFIQNTAGGYCMFDTTSLATDVVERSNRLIQNGVVLAMSRDDNKYGIVLRYTIKKDHNMGYSGGEPGIGKEVFVNYANKAIPGGQYYSYMVVDNKGNEIGGTPRSLKDANGNYIYVGPHGEFIGYYGAEGRYKTSDRDIKDATGAVIIRKGENYWSHKIDKEWIIGLPPENDRINPESLYINFKATDAKWVGPYEDGIAMNMYNDYTAP